MPAGSDRTGSTNGHPQVDGHGRSLAVPAFPQDDGSPDADLRRALVAGAALGYLPRARLLVAVVAVADERSADGSDKASSMAVVSMVNAAGQKGLLAFTGLDALRLWDPQARPVPVWGVDAARSAIEDGADALVIDVMGPHRVVLAGPELALLAGLPDRA